MSDLFNFSGEINGFADSNIARGFVLGANDKKEEGKWEWEDGSPFDYTNWDYGEPNNAGYYDNEDCLYMYGSDRKWNDAGCNRDDRGWNIYFICAKSAGPGNVPIRSTSVLRYYVVSKLQIVF